MADFGSTVSGIEKLNEYNYRYWRICMRTYLKSQGLWSIVDGDNATPPPKDKVKEFENWEMKANKALLAIEMTIDKSLLSRIEDAETPKEAWDILASLFSRRNPARLQLLERELMNTTQGTLSINEYFLKVKNLCREIEQLDAEAKFEDARIRRILINGLKPEYNSFIMALHGWEKQPSLVELENLLANQEALEQQMSKVTVKPPEIEEALFTTKSARQTIKKRDHTREYHKRPYKHDGHKQITEDDEGSDKGEYYRWQPIRGECFICGRRGHYARDCKFLKNIQSNLAKMERKKDESEEEWDFEATYAVEEEISKENEWDFEAIYAVEDDVPEEEEWDLSGNNDELWTGDLDNDDNFEVTSNYVTIDTINAQHKDDLVIKTNDNTKVVEKDRKDELILGQEEIDLVITQPGVPDWLAEAGVIKFKDSIDKTCHGVQRQGELPEFIQYNVEANKLKDSEKCEDVHTARDYSSMIKEIKNHSTVVQDSPTLSKVQGKLIEKRRVTHDKYDMRDNIKRPPDQEAIRH